MKNDEKHNTKQTNKKNPKIIRLWPNLVMKMIIVMQKVFLYLTNFMQM